jgi:uncharacterized RDD family membrane protein YckC
VSVTLDDDEDVIAGLRPDGTPDPAYAAGLGIIPAPTGRRALAFLLDAAILLVLASPAVIGATAVLGPLVLDGAGPAELVAAPQFVLGLVLLIVGQAASYIYLLVQLIVHGRRGVTVGKKAAGLRTVHVARLERPGFLRILLRAVIMSGAATIVPYLGAVPFLLSTLWDPQGRGRSWHDRMSGVWLVDVRRGLDPYDRKRMRHARRRAAGIEITPPEPLPSLATGSGWAQPTFVPAVRSSSGVVSPRHDDDGRAGSWTPPPVGATEIGGPVRRAAGTPSVPSSTAGGAAPGASSAGGFAVALDDGSRIALGPRTLFGRDPAIAAGGTPAALHRLADPTLQLSKTHLELAVEGGGLWLTDLASSNGTAVRPPGGDREQATAGQRIRLAPGALVFAGGVTLTVQEARE